jgi:uncharacterized protein (DUF2249 family)
MQVKILDVTAIEPQKKHPAIFKKFDALLPGQQLLIKIDYNPKSLYYHLLGERGPTFSLHCLHNKPEIWQVKITKNKAILHNQAKYLKTNRDNAEKPKKGKFRNTESEFTPPANECMAYRILFEKLAIQLDQELLVNN